jgi:hypothetical protein
MLSTPTASTDAPSIQRHRRYYLGKMAAAISRFSRYYDEVVQVAPFEHDHDNILTLIDCRNKRRVDDIASIPDVSEHPERRLVVLLKGNTNHSTRIQQDLTEIRARLNRFCRVVLINYNPYYAPVVKAATVAGLRKGPIPNTFLTRGDLGNLAELSGYQSVSVEPNVQIPWRLLGLGSAANALLSMLPGLRWLSLWAMITLRPRVAEKKPPSISVVIPARNERGNIENALRRLPEFSGAVEVIFVEGHSSDGTWDEIQRVAADWKDRVDVMALRQQGTGKADAVRLGFSKAKGELLTILDADLTMPPEDLPLYYDAYVAGKADFVNGSRLLYKMDDDAMRFLNKLGNVFFARELSWILGTRFTDTLCGTKLLPSNTYRRFVSWRDDFGDFDPFGDFELLFPAAVLKIGSIDIPVCYRDRQYGETQISRFRHGSMLLKMTAIAFFRIRLGG